MLITSDEHVPFWMSSNNSGRFSSKESSQLYYDLRLYKAPRFGKNLDYGYGLEVISNFDGKVNNRLIQAYATVATKMFRFSVGRKEEIQGFNNHRYGFGNLVNGNNALPIPKISVQTNGWIKAPFLKNNISYKAYFAHGWFEKDRYQSGAFLHQKSFHINLHPKSQWFEFSLGLNHNAQWGGYNLGRDFEQPAGLKNYLRILLASSGGDDALATDQLNALGNHLGTWDIQGKLKFGNWVLSNYWQFLWEDSGGLTPLNWRDGIVGLKLENKTRKSIINSIRIEIIRTNDQDAEKTGIDGLPYLEPDNFLNNSVYRSGWTYGNQVIGSPVFLLLNEESISISRIKNMINGISVNVMGTVQDIDYAVSYRDFRNQGTRFESIDPKLMVKSLLFEIGMSQGPSSFVFQTEYNWSNYLGKNLGIKIEYQFDLSSLLAKSRSPE